MHGGDIRGQIEPAMRTSEACATCHQAITEAPAAHTHHAPASTGSDCYACHMPKMVYGVLEIHRTHRIQSPSPADAARYARPDACTSCHLDRSLAWAAERAREWWGRGEARRYPVPEARGDGAAIELADAVASLLAGDPVQRAVTARLAGRRDTPLTVRERAFLWPLLLTGMANDYPTIRYFSRNSLRALDEEMPTPGFADALARFDYISTLDERQTVLDELWRRWRARPKHDLPPPPAGTLLDGRYEPLADQVAALVALQARKRINIGE